VLVARQKIHAPHSVVREVLFRVGETGDGLAFGQILAVAELRVPENRDAMALPPRVEYELTDMGRSLIKPLEDLCHWAHAHVAERNAARKKFDSAAKVSRR